MILRIKVAAHALCVEKVNKLPFKDLIAQCHQVIQSNESILFDTKDSRQNMDASEAIR